MTTKRNDPQPEVLELNGDELASVVGGVGEFVKLAQELRRNPSLFTPIVIAPYFANPWYRGPRPR